MCQNAVQSNQKARVTDMHMAAGKSVQQVVHLLLCPGAGMQQGSGVQLNKAMHSTSKHM